MPWSVMDFYHIWCNLKPEASDVAFVEAVDRYLGELERAGRILAFRVTRRKLGFGPTHLGEFHVEIEVRDLAQLDTAFHDVSTRTGAIEELHAAVNQNARDVTFALYRDFPDPQRRRGEERF